MKKEIYNVNFRFCAVLVLALSFFILDAQESEKRKKSSLLIGNIGYRANLTKQSIISSGNGLNIELGLNPGKFISENLILALYGGWAWRDGLWNTSFHRGFVHDYRTSINTDHGFTGIDSALVATSGHLFSSKKGRSATLPGCKTNSFNNYSLYYGIMIKLPYAYVPVLKIYTGITHSFHRGEGVLTSDTDYNSFFLKRPMSGFEIIVLQASDYVKNKSNSSWFFKSLALSLYFEKYNFSKSSINFDDGERESSLQLHEFTNESFMKKYKADHNVGVRLSLLLM